MANGKYECPRFDDGVPIPEFRCVFYFHRYPGEVFNHVFTDHAGVVAGAASRDDDAIDVPELVDVCIEPCELGVPFCHEQSTAHGVAQYFGLLENFLEHEMRESALRDSIGVEIYVLDFALDFVAVHVDNGIAAVLHLHDVVVVEVHHLLRVVDNGRNVTRKEKVAFVPDAEDERGAAACADERTRFVAGDYGKAECPLDFGDGLEYGSLEITGVKTSYQVGHNFGIGLGLEFDPVGDEFGFEACVVFDNAVVDN